MSFFQRVRKLVCKQCAVEKARAIAHLPIWQRIFHKNARRTVVAYAMGSVIIFIGVAVAKQGHHFEHNYLAEWSIDAIGYSIHGIGLVPFVRYAEAAWTLVMGVSEVAAETIVDLEAVE